MTPPRLHWFVLAGGLSPYTLALWERVVERSGHAVTLAYIPQEPQPDFAHETDVISSASVELVPIQSLRAVVKLGARCARAPHAAILCMGHSPIYNIAISAVAGAMRRDKRLLLYMSDANGIALADTARSTPVAKSVRFLKRMVLGTTFAASLDLGYSNALAHRMLGIRQGIDIPLLPVEFPEPLEPALPAPLLDLVRDLPRPRLLTVARLSSYKNLVAQANAFQDAVAEGMPGSLTVVGEGPQRARLEPVFCRMPGRAVLAGAVPFTSSRRIFGAFDGMMLASTTEPWGIAIIEGLGWGLPVLSSRQCGAGLSMARETGDAVKLCGTSRGELKADLLDFVGNLDRHTAAARLAAPTIREKFGLTPVADALINLGSHA